MEFRTNPTSVLSHWHQLIEGLNSSPLAFYESVQGGLASRCVPETTVSSVEYQESGLMSAKRSYLHVSRGRQVIDICAAPFGTGFFISSWLAETRVEFPPIVRLLIVIGYFVTFGFAIETIGLFTGPVVCFSVIVAGMWLIQSNREVDPNNEDYVLAMPMLGSIYERFFKADTYFAMDTALMFRDAVHSAVLEAVDGLTSQNGLRALSELERRPAARTLFGHPGK